MFNTGQDIITQDPALAITDFILLKFRREYSCVFLLIAGINSSMKWLFEYCCKLKQSFILKNGGKYESCLSKFDCLFECYSAILDLSVLMEFSVSWDICLNKNKDQHHFKGRHQKFNER